MSNQGELATIQAGELAVTGMAPVLRIIESALKEGVDVAAIEKLAGLAERMQDRAAGLELAQALADFQEECPPVPRTSVGAVERGGSRVFCWNYASLETIAQHIRSYLPKHGLSYTWDSSMGEGRLRCVCVVRHAAGGQTHAAFEAPVENSGASMSGAQTAAKTLTFAKRQTLIQALGLVTADPDDDDGQSAGIGTPIGSEQARELNELFRCVAEDMKVEERRVRGGRLTYLRVRAVEEIPASRYADAVSALEDKRKGTK